MVAFAVAGLIVFFAALFYGVEFGDNATSVLDLPLGPRCIAGPDRGCVGWEAPSGIGGWVPWFAVQVGMLAVMVLAVAAGVWLWRRRPLRDSWRAAFRPHTLGAALLALVGTAIVLDLGVYFRFWHEWTGLPANERVGPDTSLGAAMAQGVAVAGPLAITAAWGAIALLRKGRRDQTESPAPSAEV